MQAETPTSEPEMRPSRTRDATQVGVAGTRILFIAPLPPPITGHSLASQVFLDGLPGGETTVVNLSLGSRNDGSVTGRRLFEVAKVAGHVWRGRRGADAIYLTISESLAGNLKDLLIYVLCAGRLDRMVIHLHGGSIGRLLFERHPWLRRLNAAFIRRLRGVVILGRSHERIFAGMLPGDRIHVVPNFAEDALFLDREAVATKFGSTLPLRILYVSGMTEAKGYAVLLDAFEQLPRGIRDGLRLDFAGRFDSEGEQAKFLGRIARLPGTAYHGVVEGEAKRALFAGAHVFCLPTAMLEGQPISILEAYASGCVVLTTGQPGIRDIFSDGTNGIEVDAGSAASIAAALTGLVQQAGALASIALANRQVAEQHYRTTRYTAALTRIVMPALRK